MLGLYEMKNVLYGQTEEYEKMLSNVEKMYLNAKDEAEAEKNFRFWKVLLQVHGARTPTSEYFLKQLAKEENRDIIKVGSLLHLDTSIQSCTNATSCMEEEAMKRRKIQYEYEGKSYNTTGNSLDDCVTNALDKHMGELKQQIAQMQQSPQPQVQQTSDVPLFQPYAEKWFENHKRLLRKNTATGNVGLFKNHIFPFLGEMRLDEITLDVLQTFFNEKMDAPEERGKSESTLKKIKWLIGQVLAEGVEDGYITKNYAKSCRLVVKGIPEKKREPMTEEQVRRLCEQLPRLPLQDRLLVALPLFTGMRRGEFLGLQWDCVSLEKGIIHVKQGRNVSFDNNRPVLTDLKAKSSERFIAIPAPLRSILEECPNRNGFVVGGGMKPITESKYQRARERIDKTTGLFGATAHVCRHTYATLLDGMGSSMDTQYALGHADMKTTRRYTHKGENTARKMQSSVDACFVQLASGDMT